MAAPRRIPPQQFAEAWIRHGGLCKEVAKFFNLTEANCFHMRKRVEKRLNIVLPSSQDKTNRKFVKLPKLGVRRIASIVGPMVVFGDRHLWPGEKLNAADQALLILIERFQPKIVVLNGDLLDGAKISRHAPTSWSKLPSVIDELQACQAYLKRIEEVAPDDASLIWCAGNHDSRFSIRLAELAPEYMGVQGMDLKDHFPNWQFCWSLEVNRQVMVKHRLKGGTHATHQNTVAAGMTTVTNHLHRNHFTSWGDYNGRRWGVDPGVMSDFGPDMTKFTSYTEDNPLTWGSGFAWITFDHKKRLLPPELCSVVNGRAYFRGELIAEGLKKAA